MYWRELILDQQTWRVLCSSQPLNMDVIVRKTACIAERRSKGRIFKGVDRLSGERYTFRKLSLDTTNAGKDDGFPTSLLREMSHLLSLDSPYVAKVHKIEVRDKLVQICFEHLDLNLKEFRIRHLGS